MASTSEYLVYLSGPMDRWDWIATLYYGDPTLFGLIMAANPNLAATPFLPPGVQVIVPVIDEEDLPTPTVALSPWLS